MARTRKPREARYWVRCVLTVVFPEPPLKFVTAIIWRCSEPERVGRYEGFVRARRRRSSWTWARVYNLRPPGLRSRTGPSPAKDIWRRYPSVTPINRAASALVKERSSFIELGAKSLSCRACRCDVSSAALSAYIESREGRAWRDRAGFVRGIIDGSLRKWPFFRKTNWFVVAVNRKMVNVY